MKIIPTLIHYLTQWYFLYPALIFFVIWAIRTQMNRRR